VAVGELVVAGAWDSAVSLRGQNTTATTIITTITAIAYKKRLSPKKFIITSRNRPKLICDIGGEFGACSIVHGIPPESGWIGGLRGQIARFLFPLAGAAANSPAVSKVRENRSTGQRAVPPTTANGRRGTSLAGGHLVRGSIVAWHRLFGYGSKWRLAVGTEMQGFCIACRASASVRGTAHDDHCLPPGQRGWDLMKATKPSRNLRSWPSTVASVSAPAASNTPWARDTMSRPPNHGTVPSVRSTGSQAF
jgi:hypothetical protein